MIINTQNVENIHFNGLDVEILRFNGQVVWQKQSQTIDGFYFNAESPGSSVTLSTGGNRSMEYSTDYQIWNNYTFGTAINLNNVNDKVWFRYPEETTTTLKIGKTFSVTGRVSVAGDITYLINKNGNVDTVPVSYCFEKLFQNCTGLVSAKDLKLTSTTLAVYCYQYMFNGCSDLVEGPELPSTDIRGLCYYHLFDGCTSLRQAPELPGTDIHQASYGYMFYNCTSLTEAPELPGTTLASSCYSYMFYGCTGLTECPELPATTLATNCYEYMFANCDNITEAPELPATTLANYCYRNMFDGCSSLENAPEILPATTLQTYCYQYMFRDCTSLTEAPALPATTLANYCYSYMFYGCTGLTECPELPATTLAQRCYYYMFYGCTGLSSAPTLPATTLYTYCYAYMFSHCTGLTEAPELPATTLDTYCYSGMFAQTGLIKSPTLPATTLVSYCYSYMFYGCQNLNYVLCLAVTNIPTSISTTYCENWLSNVPSGGTFVTASGKTKSWVRSESGVPSNWNISDVDSMLTLDKESISIQQTDVSYSETIHYQTLDPDAILTYSCSADWVHVIIEENVQVIAIHVDPIFDPDVTIRNAVILLYLYGVQLKQIKVQQGVVVSDILCFTAEQAGSTIKLIKSGTSTTNTKYFEYSSDTVSWTPYTTGTSSTASTITLTNAGDMVYFRNTGQSKGLSSGTNNYYYFKMTGKIAASGNVMYMLSNDGETGLSTYSFYNLFSGCSDLTEAPELPATTLANNCYQYMFNGCSGLTKAPEILPATTLAQYCYYGMFDGCSILTVAPELPAKDIYYRAYYQMFYKCSNLKTIYCYAKRVTSSTGSIPSWETWNGQSANRYPMYNWLYDGSSSGTFYKNPSTNISTKGTSSVPRGWAINDWIK